MLEDFELKEIVEPLLAWYKGHARILPWREDPKPYYVWVSEIMLQQTRVEAVKPYFERFIKELPTVADLAECPEDRLLKLWEGLGYYNRARNLKVAANQIMEQYGGRMPEELTELLNLKGIGSYTAGAIASIAYGKKLPAVDGNVLRVISRVSADDSDIMKQSVRKNVEARLLELMQTAELDPSMFNQALMELGAMVCVPNGQPHCKDCPWCDFCKAHLQNNELQYPVKSKAKARKIEKRTVLLVMDGNRTAIHKRPNQGLLAGLYEYPNVPGELDEEEALAYVRQMGCAPLRIRQLPEAKHIFSHVEWHMSGYLISVAATESDTLHFPKSDLGEFPWMFIEVSQIQKKFAIPTAFIAYSKCLFVDKKD